MTEIFSNLSLGSAVAFSIQNILYCFVGVTLGTFIGVLPGLGPLVTIAMLIPLTIGIPPDGAIIMLSGIYYGAAYGGSTTAILVNVPGESSAAVTCIDGYQMAQQGRAGHALAVAALGSLFAGCVGTLLIAILAKPMTQLALMFGAAEYFALMLMALVTTASVMQGSLLKALAMTFLGVLAGLAGIDVTTGTQRFTFGVIELIEGIEFSVVAMGLFAISDVIYRAARNELQPSATSKIHGLMPSWSDLRKCTMPVIRGTTVGSVIGPLPGPGQTISAFAAYMIEKRVSRDPSRFGRGAIEGVAAPEAANNAAAQTSFIPTLTLGVPGSATMALILGALLVQGITPGPQVVTEHPQLFWGLIVSMWIGNVLLVALNLPLVGLWVKLLSIPYRWLYPGILSFCCIGIYSISFSSLDVQIVAIFGFIGYIFYKLDFEPAPFILGFVLGPMMEEHFRRAMLLSRGDPTIFLTRPISLIFILVSIAFVASVLISIIRRPPEGGMKSGGLKLS